MEVYKGGNRRPEETRQAESKSLLADQLGNQLGERRFVAAEAFDHRSHYGLWIKAFDIEG